MTCPCEGKNPQNLRELIKCVEPILFHKVIRPASLGDDTDTPADELQYKNVLLTYEANNHSYLYSSDGVPTFISLGDVDTAALEAAIQELREQLQAETAARQEGDNNLQNELAMETIARDVAITAESTARQEADEEFQAALNSNSNEIEAIKTTSVQKDTAVSADTSTVTITKTTGELTGPGSETGMPLPVASAESAGVMNSATYNAVQANAENIDSILNGAVLIENLPADPTQVELTAQWKAVTGKTQLINRASIYDKTNGKIWYYYTNVNEWQPADIQNPEINVSIATNDTAGIVKGSTEDGQVAVEADGSMSLNGYDGIQHDIDNLTQLVAGIEVPKMSNYVISAPTNQAGTTDSALVRFSQINDVVQFRASSYNTNTGGKSTFATNILTASEEHAGTMSRADKAKLNSLLEIKSLNDSLELDENGQLSVVGGGSDVNLLSTYTASPAEGDVYDASYVNSRLDNASLRLGETTVLETRGSVVIGSHSRATGVSVSVAVGYNCLAKNSSVAFGMSSEATGNYSVAVGAQYGAVPGARAVNSYTVALGSGSLTSRSKEVSIGGATWSGQQTPFTRFLANVTAGELPTDAVNLQQMQDYVAENAGNPFTEMETTRVQNLPPAVVTGFEDTTYGTDTITMHLDTKDLATGGVSVQELELEGATANTDEAGGHAGLMTAFQATQLAALAEAGATGTISTEDFNNAWEAA